MEAPTEGAAGTDSAMKKAILILLAISGGAGAVARPAATPSFTVLLAGGSASNMIQIWLTPDGRDYVIDSIVPLEVGRLGLHQPAKAIPTS